MITVSHKIDGAGRHYSTVTNPDYRTYGFETAAYADGTRKPNYPVPAIRLEVDLIMIWIDRSLDKAKREAKCFRAFRKHFMRKFMKNYRTSGPRYN